jgi:hypothetical protein
MHVPQTGHVRVHPQVTEVHTGKNAIQSFPKYETKRGEVWLLPLA